MSKSLKFKILSTCSIAIIATAATVFPAHAYDGATLSGIKIDSTDNGYKITMQTDKNMPVRKYITSDNKIEVDLNDTQAARSVNTIYNNAPNVDHVIVQPIGTNNVKLFIQGEDIASSDIAVETSATTGDVIDQSVSNVLSKKNEESSIDSANNVVVLNRPIGTYRSVISEDEETEPVNPVLATLKSIKLPKGLSKNSVSMLGFLAILISLNLAQLNKLFGKKVTINLGENNSRDRELALSREIAREKGLMSGMSDNSPRRDTSRLVGQNSYTQYGLNSYQKSDVYPTANNSAVGLSSLGIKKTNPVATQPQEAPVRPQTARPQTSRLAAPKTRQSQATKRAGYSKVSQQDINKARTNVDSMKFLESMAKIYERSGRVDLANGLQNNISKVRTSADFARG